MLTDADRKWLTEKVLGEGWIDQPEDHSDTCMCHDCVDYRQCNRTFTTWQDFGDLWSRMERKVCWDRFLMFAGFYPQATHEDSKWLVDAIHPIHFAELIVQFGKENPEEFE